MDAQPSIYNGHKEYVQLTTFLLKPPLDLWAGQLAPNFYVRNKSVIDN
jgi:hypothetical protein